MDLGGALGDHQRIGDRAIAGALRDQRQHLPLARRQRADGPPARFVGDDTGGGAG